MSAESARLAGREHSFEQCADRTDQCGRYRTDSELPAKYRAVKALDGMMMMNSSAEGEEKRMGASIGPVLVVNGGAGSGPFHNVADTLESKIDDVVDE